MVSTATRKWKVYLADGQIVDLESNDPDETVYTVLRDYLGGDNVAVVRVVDM